MSMCELNLMPRRNFIHKKIIGAVGGAIGGFIGGGPLGAIGGAIGGFGKGGASTLPAPVPVSGAPFTSGGIRFTTGGCSPGFFRDSSGQCVQLLNRDVPGFAGTVQRALPFGRTGTIDFGDAVMGRFGAALEPGFRATETAVCPRGTVRAVDGLCYNKRDLRNSDRMWPRGRRPLLTGGEMRAISVAAGAAKKLQRTEKRLQSLGMLKKASPTRRRALPSGHHAHVAHD